MKERIAVGISGGIDSQVTAKKLQTEGYEVIGLTMYLFDVECDGKMVKPEFLKEAEEVCELLGIEHHIIDLRHAFKNEVIEPFIKMYTEGKTPNPCALCNPTIKYGQFLDIAMSYNVVGLATGHYANIIYDAKRKRYRLFKGLADRKDQSYILYGLSQRQLSMIHLPLGSHKSKEETKQLAEHFALKTVQKNESMGICFIPSGDYAAYIDQSVDSSQLLGKYVDMDGNEIAAHSGIHRHTIGQKRGLDIPNGHGYTVINIDPESMDIVLASDDNVYVSSIEVSNVNIIAYDAIDALKITCKVCQWGYHLPATVKMVSENKAVVDFDSPVRAVALGQAAVFYEENEIIGGGIIEKKK